MMTVKPFLVKFARPIPSDSTETRTSGSEDKSIIERFQNRWRSTIATKVDRETTDDR